MLLPRDLPRDRRSVAALPKDTLPSAFTVRLPNVFLSEVRVGWLMALKGLGSMPGATVQVAE